MRLNGFYVFVISLVLSLSLVTSLSVDFVPPTPSNGSSNSSYSINVTANISFTDTQYDLTYSFINSTTTTNVSFLKGCVAGYNFNNLSSLGENDTFVYDICSGINNATANQTGYYFNSSGGKYRGAYQFDGKNVFFNISYNNIINYSNNWSASFWLKASYLSGSDASTYNIIEDNVNAANKVFTISVQGTGRISFWYNNASVSSRITNTRNVTLDNWYYVAIVLDRNNQSGAIYFNGIADTLTGANIMSSPNYSVVGNIRSLKIGTSRGTSNFFNGSLDDIMIYNRSLTSDEIKVIYNTQLAKYSYNNLTVTINQNINDTRLNYTALTASYYYQVCGVNTTLAYNCTPINNINRIPILNKITSLFSKSLFNLVTKYGFHNYRLMFTYNATLDTDGDGILETNSDYQTLRTRFLSTGAKQIRKDMALENYYTNSSPSVFNMSGNLTFMKDYVTWARNNRITTTFIADFTPNWLANLTSGNCNITIKSRCEPYNLSLYGDIVVDYLNQVGCDSTYCDVEVWNEPDTKGFWLDNISSSNITRILRYEQLYNTTYNKIKLNYPTMKVGAGALSGVINYSGSEGIRTSGDFMSYILDNLTYDFFSYHQYPSYTSDIYQYTINRMNTVLGNCTIYSANCSDIRITENNLQGIENNYSSMSTAYAKDTAMFFLPLYNPTYANFSIYWFKFSNRNKYGVNEENYPERYYVYSEAGNDNTSETFYSPYYVIKDLATYHPSGATIYNSSSDYDAVKVVSSRTIDGKRYITIINTDTDSVNLTINTNDPSIKITRIDTNEVFRNVSYGTFNIGVLNSYDVVTYGVESREICSQTDAASYSLIMIACALAIVVFMIAYISKKGFEDLTPGDFVIMSIGLIVSIILIGAIGDNLQSICYFT